MKNLQRLVTAGKRLIDPLKIHGTFVTVGGGKHFGKVVLVIRYWYVIKWGDGRFTTDSV